VETDYFIEFSAEGDFLNYGLEKRGEDFFNLSRRNMARFTYSEDLPGFLAVFTKENVLHEVDTNGSMSVTYRMMFGDEPKYVMMKATRLDARHIVIGTSNVHAEVQKQKTAAVKANIAQALSSDYFLIFYLDTKTNRYIEYHSTDSGRELDVEQGSEDFFTVSRSRFLPDVCREDKQQVSAVLDKDHLLSVLEENGTYSMDYRMNLNGVPTYVHMKASRMADKDDPHIVIGLRNIDAQVRREQAQASALRRATELANRDGLTGVKSKRVFVEAEQLWDARIRKGTAVSFAIAVFDINGLKQVNDTLGHAAGDDLIRSASAAICGVFQHSPVYRIGGDEFAAILTGGDYEKRETLREDFLAGNAQRAASGGAVVACGMSDYSRERDNRFQDVFERADNEMYDNKNSIKQDN
jgi:diguanylate cyclase (GGDEF) domain